MYICRTPLIRANIVNSRMEVCKDAIFCFSFVRAWWHKVALEKKKTTILSYCLSCHKMTLVYLIIICKLGL
jgi:hypothetical protein